VIATLHFFGLVISKHSMLGLWSLGIIPMGITLHLAFEVTLSDLLEAANGSSQTK
jgi:hypothetical protein